MRNNVNIIKLSVLTAASAIGFLAASPSFACIAGPYFSVGAPVAYPDTVYASQNTTLYADSTINSANGVYSLKFQEDGNLVLYKNGTQVIWDINKTNCIPTPNEAYRTRFQPDGNLVVYWSTQSSPLQEIAVWDTNTAGHPNARLVVQNDGNVVIYDSNNRVLWAIRR